MSLLSKFFFDKEKNFFLVESSNNLSEIFFFLTFWFRGRKYFDVGVTN